MPSTSGSCASPRNAIASLYASSALSGRLIAPHVRGCERDQRTRAQRRITARRQPVEQREQAPLDRVVFAGAKLYLGEALLHRRRIAKIRRGRFDQRARLIELIGEHRRTASLQQLVDRRRSVRRVAHTGRASEPRPATCRPLRAPRRSDRSHRHRRADAGHRRPRSLRSTSQKPCARAAGCAAPRLARATDRRASSRCPRSCVVLAARRRFRSARS